MTRARAQRMPTRSASVWLWLDILAKLSKLHPIALLFVIALVLLAVMVVVAWWPFVLSALAVYLLIRVYRRHLARREWRGQRIPFGGRLSLVEWLACRMIEAGEGVLRRHNRRRQR